jgi:hypothetical protein
MAVKALSRRVASTAILVLAMLCTACASSSKQVGQVAGDVVGGTAWVAVKGAVLAGRTVKGAAHGVHEEFSTPSKADQAKAKAQTVASLSQ